MKSTILTLSLLFAFTTVQATIRYVDPSGKLGKQSIQAVITDCVDGDTVRILPGSYQEQIMITTNIVVQGGGALSTFIDVSGITTGAAVTMSSGKIEWVSITSGAVGLSIVNATAVNCVFSNCGTTGVQAAGPNAVVVNCLSLKNGGPGFQSGPSCTLTTTNCIALSNSVGYEDNNGAITTRFCDGYNNSGQNFYDGWGKLVQVSCVQVDPSLSSTYSIATNSQVAGAGDPLLLNLDGSPSDMGYYGGPDAPLLPYIAPPQYPAGSLQADGTIQFTLVGKVGY